jgi:nitrate reductase delta subunit
MAMLGSGKKSAAFLQALERVKEWTRVRFSLAEDVVILVSEIVCSAPGCPPLETVIAFWTGDTRHHFKIFKPVEEVVDDDLPPYWMKEALAVPEGYGCDCC